ncbi:protein of unknown function [Methylotuvimicrobium alcaliphilum 20Z]|uniref:Uncharacterized protein n=1 Tax=Methylotuvimicrobium alcaliphilum (strain DSM 19304 / NCIMB 14124 / VKM B-2133 / 20Z) TaxID=1091494 RepID=G4T172_META2|nr:protein of unknown function [Methylotuvimicrobium alcaliphilum 20Z]
MIYFLLYNPGGRDEAWQNAHEQPVEAFSEVYNTL